MDHWAITTSSGRRVSLLCDDDNDSYSYSSASSNSAPTPPLSPDTRKARAYREGSTSSGSSSSSVRSYSPPHYSPQTPPNFSLPPLEKLLPAHADQYFPSLGSRSNSFSSSPIASPLCTTHEESVRSKNSHPSSVSTISNPPSPKSTSSNPVIKRSSRRYTCHCGKSFTTSGHLARHTRIHTGEKNYVCPDHNCTARFSRQDNCMQHYRTHQSGSASKRAARRRRMSTDSSMSGRDRETDAEPTSPVSIQHQPRSLSYHSSQQPYSYGRLSGSFGSEDGLTALASVAIAYP